MINTRQTKSKSFHQYLRSLNIFMAVVIVSSMVAFNVINIFSVDRYNAANSSLKNLSLFYDNVDYMTQNVKDYFYTESDSSKARYETYMQDAFDNINALKQASTNEDVWRFQNLENMLVNYQSICEDLIQNFMTSNNYEEDYDTFLKAGQLINETATEYYDLITTEIDSQLANLTFVRNVTMIASFLIFLILIWWLWNYSHRLTLSITRPIEVLLKNINQVKRGKYDLSQLSSASKEMEDLCDAIDDMAVAVQKNILTTKENAALERKILLMQNESLQKDELLAQSELKMLQNQINPHFLFNTLNMIYKMAIQEGAEDAAELLVKTSQLLRYGLDKQNKMSDIQSEVEMLENYIAIQMKRLGNRVQFNLQYNNCEEIKDITIPGMILQPLVENAIKHGLADVMENGEIEINVGKEDNYLYIIISDNGKGMDATSLEALIVRDFQNEEEEHMGLYNVVRRLRMYYQKAVSISVNSDLDCGFEIIIKVELS